MSPANCRARPAPWGPLAPCAHCGIPQPPARPSTAVSCAHEAVHTPTARGTYHGLLHSTRPLMQPRKLVSTPHPSRSLLFLICLLLTSFPPPISLLYLRFFTIHALFVHLRLHLCLRLLLSYILLLPHQSCL